MISQTLHSPPAPKKKVLKYGAYKPTNRDALENQFRLANRYSNSLVEVVREHRERRNRMRLSKVGEGGLKRAAEVEDAIAAIESEVAALTEEIKAEHIRQRSRRIKLPAKTRLKEVKKELRGLKYEQRKLARDVKLSGEDTATLNAERKAAINGRNNEFSSLGLDWGTRWRVYQKMPHLMKSSTPPKFKSFRNVRRKQVALQFQKRRRAGEKQDDYVRWRDLFIENKLFWLERLDKNDGKTSNRARKRTWYRAHMRIGKTDPQGEYDYISFDVILHDMPGIHDEMVVRSVTLQQSKVGPRERWHLMLTVDAPPVESVPKGTVGIDVGFRRQPAQATKSCDGRMGDELRIGHWAGSDGRDGELILPKWMLDKWASANHIRSLRDTAFDGIKAAIGEWLKSHKHEPLKEHVVAFSQWKSCNRMQSLVRVWRDNRVKGDESIFIQAEKWRKSDYRMASAEGHLYESFTNARREFYRVLAANLAKRYRYVALEDLDLRKFSVTPGTETEGGPGSTFRQQKNRAALSTLRLALANRLEVVEVDPAGTSKTCSRCGAYKSDLGSDTVYECESCGATLDRDKNAAINIMVRGCERLGDAETPVVARDAIGETTCVDNEAHTDVENTPSTNHSQNELVTP